MNIREQIKKDSAAAVKTEMVDLAPYGIKAKILVRGMMQGERLRVASKGRDADGREDPARSIPLMIALCCLDPESKEPLWNANAREDIQEINALPPDAADALQGVCTRLSGLDAKALEAGKALAGKKSSDSSSPFDSDEPQPS